MYNWIDPFWELGGGGRKGSGDEGPTTVPSLLLQGLRSYNYYYHHHHHHHYYYYYYYYPSIGHTFPQTTLLKRASK